MRIEIPGIDSYQLPEGGYVIPGGGYVRTPSGILVPRDGPNNVYVPTTEAHLGALSIPVSSDCWHCQDADTALTPSIGEENLAQISGSSVYGATVAGWERKFVGNNIAGESSGRWDSGARSLAAGTSCVMLVYAAIHAPSGTARNLASARGPAGSTGGPAVQVRGDEGEVRPSIVLNNVSAELADEHGGITTVRPYLMVRDSINDVSRLYTTLGTATTTHFEGAVTDQVVTIGNGATGASRLDWRMGLIHLWEPPEAEALINAGLANESLFTRLGWTLGPAFATVLSLWVGF